MYELPGRIRFSEVDENGKLTMVGLLNYLQDCAIMHSDDAGYPVSKLMELNRGWYVTSWQIHIYKMPALSDKIFVRTYPIKVKGFLGYRDYAVYSEDEKMLCVVHSEWIFMDNEKGRPSRILEGMAESYGLDEPMDYPWDHSKLNILDGEVEAERVLVEHHMLDYNGHMNNSYHIRIAQRVVKDEKAYNHIRVQYKKQAKENAKIIVAVSDTEFGKQVSLKDEDNDAYAIVMFETRES